MAPLRPSSKIRDKNQTRNRSKSLTPPRKFGKGARNTNRRSNHPTESTGLPTDRTKNCSTDSSRWIHRGTTFGRLDSAWRLAITSGFKKTDDCCRHAFIETNAGLRHKPVHSRFLARSV